MGDNQNAFKEARQRFLYGLVMMKPVYLLEGGLLNIFPRLEKNQERFRDDT